MMRGFYTPECNSLYATARPSPGTAVAARGTALATASDLERSQRVGGDLLTSCHALDIPPAHSAQPASSSSRLHLQQHHLALPHRACAALPHVIDTSSRNRLRPSVGNDRVGADTVKKLGVCSRILKHERFEEAGAALW